MHKDSSHTTVAPDTVFARHEPFALLQAVLSKTNARPLIQREIARPLTMALIEQMPPADHALAHHMVAALWPEDASQAQARMAAVTHEIDALHDSQAKLHAAELLAKLGHMYQLAGLVLREHELALATTPSTPASFLAGNLGKNKGRSYESAVQAVEALNTPRIALTFTAHPTNTNSLSSMLAQRNLGMALAGLIANKDVQEKSLTSALNAYSNAPLLPEKPNGLPGRTVWSETHDMLYHLNAVYDDLDQVYAGYDRELAQQSDYDPTALKLNIGFHSWGSSADKDGNKNVNADTTLYALAMHHQHILMKYRNALARIHDPSLDEMRAPLIAACDALSRITREIEGTLNAQNGHLSEAEHDRYRAALAAAVQGLEPKAWETTLEAAYRTQPDAPQRSEILSLLRHMRIFGASFGTLEYRETAEEFTRIIATLIPEYPLDKKDDPSETIQTNETTRQHLLNAVLADRQKMAELSAALKTLGDGKETIPYSDKDVGPIAYHTRKRLELARDFPATIHDHVLAECQHTSNLLELLVLQQAVAKDGKRPTLGIIPLFEDREPLLNAPQIISQVLDNKHYLAHIAAVQHAQGHATPAQQIQLAHSDNARRNGLPAARALIYQAHQQVRDTMKAVNAAHDSDPIAIQFYEGGSLTDSYRGGTRAISASINEFGLHGFSKMTAQGGDLLNYFNLPHSTYQVMMRNITHNAAHLKRPSGDARFHEEKIIAALARCSDDYKVLFEGMDAPKLNDFLSSIGFAEESAAGNISSRAGVRSNGSGGVDATKVRTISFSEGCQHAGLNPSWMGSLNLRTHMNEVGIDANNPAILKKLYDSESPLFKDVIDRVLFGLVRTDMEYLGARSNNHALMAPLRAEYDAAFKLAIEAYTGKPFAAIQAEEAAKGGGLNLSTAKGQHHFLIREVYTHMQDVFADQDRFMKLLRHMKPTANDNGPRSERELSTLARLATTLHNAGDTIIHGRLPLIDDPIYANIYCCNHHIVRPHVPQSGLLRTA